MKNSNPIYKYFIIALFSIALVSYLKLISFSISDHELVLKLFRKHEKVEKKLAGMFTPYAIIPGGGERYLLTSAQALQSLGYHVVIMVTETNPCKTIRSLQNTANALRVKLNYHHIEIQIVTISAPYEISGYHGKFDVFFLLGNEKLPQYRGLGKKLNIFMCQFPFDMYQKPTLENTAIFSDYDVVLLNSHYTYGWYAKVAQSSFEDLRKINRLGPTVKILYPPVDPFPPPPPIVNSNGLWKTNIKGRERYESELEESFNIIMIGRFFVGRQSKGHDRGIEMFKELCKKTTRRLHLTLVGNIHPSQENYEYVDNMKMRAFTDGLPVTFLNNAAPDAISVALSKANIYWHLTGINQVEHSSEQEEDPASWEHFGIAIVEAMASGCIPIVLDKGGTRDIISQGVNGFLASDASEFVERSLKLANMNANDFSRMQKEAIETSKKFHVDKFIETFRVLATRMILSRHFRVELTKSLPSVRNIPLNIPMGSNNIAVIIEPEINAMFEFCVRNVMFFLGSSWMLQVYYSSHSEAFVRYSLRGINNVQFIPLPINIVSTKEYNLVMKSPEFWRNIRTYSRSGIVSELFNIKKLFEVNNEKVLIFQSDSIMLRHGIEDFLKFDYIGAPWNLESNKWAATMHHYGIVNTVGNGGFSLRSLDAMIKISDAYGSDPNPSLMQEDIFFSHMTDKLKYKIADEKSAYMFAREVAINCGCAIQASEHLALHAAWYYMPPELFERIFDAMMNRMLMSQLN